MIPYRTPSFIPFFFPSLVWRLPGREPTLYLTFDDGPVPGPTEEVLALLKEHSIPATFFCIGDNIRKHPRIFERVLAEGHSVGNHTFNHLNGWGISPEDYLSNVSKCEEAIVAHNALPVAKRKLFRPPYGKITQGQIKLLKHYKIVMWDVLTQDFNASVSAETSLRKSIKATRNGSVVIFHDSLKAAKKMSYMLPRFIRHFKEKGYRFDVIPQ